MKTVLTEVTAFIDRHWVILFSIGVLIGATVAFVEHLQAG